MKAVQLVLPALMIIGKVSGFSSDKHVEVGGLFDFRDLPDDNHADDSFFNTDIISMYNSVLNHVSSVVFSCCPSVICPSAGASAGQKRIGKRLLFIFKDLTNQHWTYADRNHAEKIQLYTRLMKQLSVYKRLSDGQWMNTANIVPHQDTADGQIIVRGAETDVQMHDDSPVRGHGSANTRSNEVQIQDILRFVHDHSKISNNLKSHGLHKLYLRSLDHKNLRKNILGGIAQFFDENN